MTEDTRLPLDAEPSDPIVEAPDEPATPRSRPAWALPVGALLVGLLVGGGIGAAIAFSDPTQSEEYRAQSAELEGLQEDLDDLEGDFTSARRDVTTAEGDARKAAEVATQTIKDAEATLLAKATELDQREQAVAAIEARIVATSIGNGIWTVGVDVEPGTYRVSQALSGYCYWSITRSGSNGDDIIENDGPTGGFPTVTLSAGQDFENSRCGTFVKQ